MMVPVQIKLAACGAAAAVLGIVIAARAHSSDPGRPEIRYRFPIDHSLDARAELTSTIEAVEGRVRTEARSPFDLEDLAQLYFRRAQLDEDRRDYATAEAMARQSLAILRVPNPAVLTLAKVANARHDFRAAIALATEHLAQRKTAGGYHVLATAHLALGELAAATQAVDTAIAIKPDGGGYLTRALVMQARGRDAEAAADFAHAAALEEPGDLHGAARLRALWARFLLRRGDRDGAGQLLDEALRIVPDLPLAVALRGELALRSGDPERARALFEQAFAASRQVRYLIDQARAEELAGDRAGADALRDQVETLVRDDGGFGHRLELVEVLVDRRVKLGEAIAIARDELARRPSADVRFQLARALAWSGELAAAQEQVDAALASGAREAPLFELAARVERMRGLPARHAEDAERLDPGSHGWRGLGLP